VNYVKGLLDQIGVGGERLAMHFLSSAEGARFAEIARAMTEKIRELGPSPLRPAPVQTSEVSTGVDKPPF